MRLHRKTRERNGDGGVGARFIFVRECNVLFLASMVRRVFVVSALGLLACACGPSLSEAGSSVLLSTGDPATTCEELGPVEGRYAHGRRKSIFPSDYLNDASNDLRNHAAEMGANYVRWEAADPQDKQLAGTAYRCNGTPAPIAAGGVTTTTEPGR